MQTLSSLTELDSINIMLSTIGESPVSSLSQSESTVDVSLSRQVLREVTIDVQQEGWQFNTEVNWVMQPTVDKEILIPSNCVQIDTSGPDSLFDVAQRGTRLYDRVGHTYQFENPLTVDMILLLDYTELPQAARKYITIRAARVFQQRMVGSETLGGFTMRDEAAARTALKKLDSNNADRNILTDSWSVARVLAR